MPRKKKTIAASDKAAQSQFSVALLEQLIPGPVTPAELEGRFQQFKKSVLERALGAEMSLHLSYAPGHAKPEGAAANHRIGKSAKTVLIVGYKAAQRSSSRPCLAPSSFFAFDLPQI